MKIGVIIGRFQPFHRGHYALFEHAIQKCDRLIFIIGSAFESRTRKNPFTSVERRSIILESIESLDYRIRLNFEAVGDYPNDTDWVEDVTKKVMKHVRENDEVTLFGMDKDSSSYYLTAFPQWKLDLLDPPSDMISATDIREKFYSGIWSPDQEKDFVTEKAYYRTGTLLDSWLIL